MFWDKVASVYDLFEDVYNRKVYRGTGKTVADEIKPTDEVLECACGTGAISVYIAPVCKHLIATDYSEGMLKQTAKKVRQYANVEIRQADMTRLDYPDSRFDAVVAGNVIHLLDDPITAVGEMLRVCKPGGKVIIPTYIIIYNGKPSKIVKLFEKAGAHFKRQFDLDSYKAFFRNAGFENVEYHVVEGKMPCAVAVITKERE
ncbi:MAG: class I SAM-dependent methyltransferase [Clostridiales bacterium]|nr:class I SAM-dependent methyltransferase [Clostridiales bacterium]